MGKNRMTTQAETPEVLKTKQVRELLGVSKNVMTDLVRSNAFPNAWRSDGGQIRIPRSDVEAYKAARRVVPPAPVEGGAA